MGSTTDEDPREEEDTDTPVWRFKRVYEFKFTPIGTFFFFLEGRRKEKEGEGRRRKEKEGEGKRRKEKRRATPGTPITPKTPKTPETKTSSIFLTILRNDFPRHRPNLEIIRTADFFVGQRNLPPEGIHLPPPSAN
jgi:hypothetical protein